MLEKLENELKLRGFSDKTISAYMFQNRKFLEFSGKKPEEIGQDDIKKFLGNLISDKKQRPASVGLTLSALKFFYLEVLKRPVFEGIKAPKTEKKIPTVLAREEIKRMIEAVENPKHRLLIQLMYSSGLRVSECVTLKMDDLDLEERMGTIRSGKGRKDRHIILSEKLVEQLKDYLSKKKVDSPYIFSVKDRHITTRQAQKVVSQAAVKAGIKKRVFCHALRSSFATHLLESGTDIRVIQELLGHSNLNTTQRYTMISREQLKKVKSPLDEL